MTFTILCTLLFCADTKAFGQIEIHGRVVDEQNLPIPGVNIIIRGTVTGTISNANGAFNLKFSSDTVELFVSSIGFISQRVKITESNIIEIKLHENYYNSEKWPIKRGNKPISRKKTKTGTITTYATENISLESYEIKNQLVVWPLEGYKIFLPVDSLRKFLEYYGHQSDDVQLELDNLRSNNDTIVLSTGFIENVGENTLHDITICMLKAKSVHLVNRNDERIKSIVAREVFWIGPKGCSNCCWGGVEFVVDPDESPLFVLTYIIC